MTMEQLADEVGVSKSYIWALENNPEQRVQRTTAVVMNNLAKALGVTLQDLLGEEVSEAEGAKTKPEDVAFFRNYLGMTSDDRKTFRRMMEVFHGKKGE